MYICIYIFKFYFQSNILENHYYKFCFSTSWYPPAQPHLVNATFLQKCQFTLGTQIYPMVCSLSRLFLSIVVIAILTQILCQSPQFAFSSRFLCTQISVYTLCSEVFRTGDMAPKCLQHKHQGVLSSISSSQVQRPGVVVWCWGGIDRRILRTHGLAGLE